MREQDELEFIERTGSDLIDQYKLRLQSWERGLARGKGIGFREGFCMASLIAVPVIAMAFMWGRL